MKVTCFACALVAGLAMGAVANAEPVAKQAGGAVINRAAPQVGEVIALPKGQIPGQARYHLATQEMVIESYPRTIGEDGSNPSVRGPGPDLIWSSIDPSGFYTNRIPGGALREAFDWGVLCGDPMTDTHNINQFSFGYSTNDPDGGVYSVDIFVYWNFDPLCPADPDGTVAGFGCIAANGVGFEIINLPGMVPEGNTWIVTIDLTGFEFLMPAGEFGYSYSNWTGFTDAGPTITNENQIAAPGTDNAFDSYTEAPQTGLLGTFWFGGSPYAQFRFELFSSTGACAPTTAGACCLGDLSCTVAEEIDCDTLGGTFSGSGIPCSGTFFCYPAPADDECATAELITGFGQFAYDNRGATDSAEPDPVGCGQPQGEDVWKRWQAPCTGTMRVESCALTLTDDLFAIYSGSCGALLEVACDDDGCGPVGGASSVTFSATQGTTYFFRLGTWNSTDGGENFFDVVNVDNCEPGAGCDADWCNDGIVGVPDIFCFLSAWFALDPAARNYGGNPGVPAIFAFLSVWFATGTGPCP